jgi:hypothetical protein
VGGIAPQLGWNYPVNWQMLPYTCSNWASLLQIDLEAAILEKLKVNYTGGVGFWGK